jgi:hypothetical protein
MVHFQNEKNPDLGKFWMVLQWKMLAICYVTRPTGIFCGHLFFWAVWYIFPVLVCCTKKNLATLLQRDIGSG